jgi:hypothetical protein
MRWSRDHIRQGLGGLSPAIFAVMLAEVAAALALGIVALRRLARQPQHA